VGVDGVPTRFPALRATAIVLGAHLRARCRKLLRGSKQHRFSGRTHPEETRDRWTEGERGGTGARACMRASVRACVRACMRACVSRCVRRVQSERAGRGRGALHRKQPAAPAPAYVRAARAGRTAAKQTHLIAHTIEWAAGRITGLQRKPTVSAVNRSAAE
jgi:hypothetical protein